MVWSSLRLVSTPYILCDLSGSASVNICPSGLVWQQGLMACVYPSTSVSGDGQVKPTSSLNTTSPCTPLAMKAGQLFHPHPRPSMFLQCDVSGHVYALTCPPGLTWSGDKTTCFLQH